MAGIRKSKTGRRAPKSEQQYALDWIDLYRRAQDKEDGLLCLNPSDPPEEQTWLDGNDPEPLLQALASFAKNRTFASVDSIGLNKLLIKHDAILRLDEIKNDRKNNPPMRTGEKATLTPVEQTAKEFGLSKRSLERVLRKSANT